MVSYTQLESNADPVAIAKRDHEFAIKIAQLEHELALLNQLEEARRQAKLAAMGYTGRQDESVEFPTVHRSDMA